MRMLHPVRPEEKAVSAGRYLYMVDGKHTGHVETWLITRLESGVEVVRVDVDGREDGDHGPNLITHLHRRADGRPMWLRMRYFNTDPENEVSAAAQYTFKDAAIYVARQTHDGSFPRQDSVEIANGYGVDYHPIISHEAMMKAYPTDTLGEARYVPVFSPDLWQTDEAKMMGRALRIKVEPLPAEPITTPAGTFNYARRLGVRYQDGVEAIAWYDQNNVPVRWHYPDKGYDFVLTTYRQMADA